MTADTVNLFRRALRDKLPDAASHMHPGPFISRFRCNFGWPTLADARSAARDGDPVAMGALIQRLATSPEGNSEKARAKATAEKDTWLRALFNLNSREAWCAQGTILVFGIGMGKNSVSPDVEAGLKLLRKAGKCGLDFAYGLLGEHHLEQGEHPLAATFFRRVTDSDTPEMQQLAWLRLGDTYFAAVLAAADSRRQTEMVHCYRTALRLGRDAEMTAQAELALGCAALVFTAEPEGTSQAVKWFRRAFVRLVETPEHGMASYPSQQAALFLCELYKHGPAHLRNARRAACWDNIFSFINGESGPIPNGWEVVVAAVKHKRECHLVFLPDPFDRDRRIIPTVTLAPLRENPTPRTLNSQRSTPNSQGR